MALDFGLGEHNGYPIIRDGVSVSQIVSSIQKNVTGDISLAIQAIQEKQSGDIAAIENIVEQILENPHITDKINVLFPGLVLEGEELSAIDLFNHIYSDPDNFKSTLEYLTSDLGSFTEGYLGENVVQTGNFKSLGKLIDKVESFPMKLQGNPRLPERYKKIHSGKVRETYQHPDNSDEMILIATDRISTHDVIHMGTIKGKGKALTKMSNFWFQEFSRNDSTSDIPNQLVENPHLPDDFPQELIESTTVVKKLKALPIEAIVRGYLYGSALGGYDTKTGKLDTGEHIGQGLQKCSKFKNPIFTPSTKSDDGDDNVNFETMVATLQSWLPENGYPDINAQELAEQIKDYSLRMYEHANKVSQTKGMILGDTKFEFGLDKDGKLTLIDEACTADSSRLWTAESVVEGQEPESHDKQPTRDEVIAYWKKNPDRSGKHYKEDGFQKYPVPLTEDVKSNSHERYTGISGVFSHAA